MRVLVFGGTSFFGAEIVKLLLEEGHQVAVLTRGNKEPSWWESVRHFQADRTDRDALGSALAGEEFDVLMDNIAYQAEDVQDTLEILGGRVGRYILTSTAAVYRYAPDRTMPLREEAVDYSWEPPEFDPEDRGWQYAAGKLDAERALMTQDQVPYTILRPPIVLGPVDPTLRGYFYFQRLLDGGPLILPNGGVNSFRMVYSGDLARAYLRALDSARAENRVYNITQSEIVTTRGFVDAAAEALKVEPDIVPVTRKELEAADLEYADPYSRLVNFIPAVSRAREELGYSATSFTEWVSKTALWFRDEYRGEDSEGYDRRDREVAWAEKRRL